MVRTKRISELSSEELKQEVRRAYSELAQPKQTDCCSSTCSKDRTGLAESLGYSVEGLPQSLTESFAGCGNPVALASLQPGEVVLDLGSGAGLDAFVAAEKVGPTGQVIGVDMTQEMIDKSNANAEKLNATNVEFRLGDIEQLPVADNSVDVIISNCVINLAPDKSKVFKEAFRVLRSGGRLMISDMVLEKPLPEEIREQVAAYTGCLAGAILKEEYLQLIRDAGFEDVRILDIKVSEFVSSAQIVSTKP
jgi:SAM-dependent methyltransferase